MRRLAPCLSLLLVAAPLGGCVEARRLVMKFVSFDEGGKENLGPSIEAKYDGVDDGRPRLAARLALVADGMPMPTDIQPIPGEDARVVVLTKDGAAYVVDLKTGKHQRLFEVPVRTEVEEGLLGLAFHPRFAETRKLYLNYTPAAEQATEIAEWTWHEGKKPKAARVLLKVEQPYQNHNGGQLAFGPDGFLYVGFGDGGWADDPHGNGQDLATHLGSMLRIDVDRAADGRPYAIPKDNPFLGEAKAQPETWAYGLRNPWRYSFAPDGRLVVADVGQDAAEELSIARAGDNLGWDVVEGRRCHRPKDGCSRKGLKAPFLTYGRSSGRSITGGYVATGDRHPALKGKYVFGDFTSGRIWAVAVPKEDEAELGDADMHALGAFPMLISTFGRDARGDLLVGSFDGGAIYRILPP